MSTITKEQLIEILQHRISVASGFPESEKAQIDLELARIALASLEAEPVAVTDDMAYAFHHALSDSSLGADEVEEIKAGLRAALANVTATPAPVSVPDAMEMDDDFDSSFEHGKAVGWNACRAAMLQGSQPVIQSDELPLDYLQGHKDGLEWAAQLAEANHPQTGDWLYDDPVELAKAIRKGPDMPQLKSVPADEDDNFYSWFGRFWSENYQQNNYTTSAKQMLGTMAEFAFRAGRELATQAGNSPVIPDEKGSSLQLRNLIRQRHAEWSQATFGDVGPVGPLKHLSKEALEAAAEPEDLSEWADMQFLLWDAQRRAGISDGEITAAMEEKLKVNMARQWPEPKDGEPRMHINPAPQQEA